MTIDCETPLLDTLNAHRLTNLLGAVAAERCAEQLTTLYSGIELTRLLAAYAERAAHYRVCLASVDAQIAALVTPIDVLTALRTRRTQCEAMTRARPAERRGWAAKVKRLGKRIAALEAGR